MHDFGQAPAKAVALVLNSPKLLEAFSRMTVEEQVKMVSQLVTTVMLVGVGAGMMRQGIAGLGSGMGGAGGALQLAGTEWSVGLGFSVEQLALAGAGRVAGGLAMVSAGANSTDGAMPADTRAVRRDDAPYEAKPPKRKGVKAKKLPARKSHINEQGDLVPANPRGKTTLAEHVIGRDLDKKASSPYTSMSAPGGDKRYFGDKQIKIDLDGLAKSGAKVEIYRTDDILSVLGKELKKLYGQKGKARREKKPQKTCRSGQAGEAHQRCY